MELQELRLGNYVNWNDEGYRDVSTGVFSCWEQQELHKILKPMPLTKEWLVKFGFSGHIKFELGLIVIYLSSERNRFGLWHGDSVKMFNVPVEYVHQLQNLYFALTGNELKIK